MQLPSSRRVAVVPTIVSLLVLCSAALAEPVRPEQVREVAGTFLQAQRVGQRQTTEGVFIAAEPSPPATVTGLREVQGDDGAVVAYVAQLAPRGFVATSADTRITPIVAYSLRNPFPTDAKNPLVRLLKLDMKLRAEALARLAQPEIAQAAKLWDGRALQEAEVVLGEDFQQWPAVNTTSTGGWLRTAWHQDAPYNDLCPLDPVDGLRSYVGCVATAMAQVIHYHGSCEAVFMGIDSYSTYSGIAVDGDSDVYDFPSFQELNGLLGTIQSKYAGKTDLNDVEIAAVNFACGVAAQMDYSSEGSGASPFDAWYAFVNKFRFYSADMAGGLSKDTYYLLQENLINGLPILVGIAPIDGWGGHELVCDGYNTKGEYHLNFGWGNDRPEAITEAWYRLPAGMPTSEDVITEAILNVRPSKPSLEARSVPTNFTGIAGQPSSPRVLTIRNIGSANVTIDSITSPAGFEISRSASGYSDRIGSFQVNRSQQTLLYTRFNPTEAKGYYGPLVITYDGGKTLYALLKGTAYTGGTSVAGGEVSGEWLKANSPYFVTGNIHVPPDGFLFIEPGVKVIFLGPYSFTVEENAGLMAIGDADNPIEFTAWNREAGWTGLRFIGSGDDDILMYCTISYASKNFPLAADEMDWWYIYPEDLFGGGAYCYLSSPRFESCKIVNNRSPQGGGIYCEESDPILINTLIANNSSVGWSPQCGGIYLYYASSAQIQNCTIANNFPGGIFAESCEAVDVNNCIVWGNSIYQVQTYMGTANLSFCNVQDGYPGAGNTDADPCFFTPSEGTGADYDATAAIWTLASSSPCINAGADGSAPTDLDLAGNPRLHSNLVDQGAYENQSDLPVMTITPYASMDAGFADVDADVITSIHVTNTGALAFEVNNVSIRDANSPFFIVTPIQKYRLEPNEHVAVEVVFAPGQEKAYTGTILVESTSNVPLRIVPLRGVGVAGTIVPPGEVSGTWTKATSPYSITGDIFVPTGQKLTIEPGVTVKFAGHFGLTAGGDATLQAVGTEEEKILFTATDANEGWFGIRFVDSGDDDVLRYCTIEYASKPYTGGRDYIDLDGGAILCASSSPTIDHCTIANNYARSGGAIYCEYDSEAVITNNTIVDNVADFHGGAIYVFSASPTIAHNVIAHNYGTYSGGIENDSGTPTIRNNTIVSNRPNAMSLGEGDFWSGQMCTVVNNIVWDNEIYTDEYYFDQGQYEIRFNNIQGGWEGEGNINLDPCFVDPNNGDYRLKSQAGRWDCLAGCWVKDDVTSPCIDAGDPSSDWTAELWPNGGRINMGAYGGTAEASMSASEAGSPADLNGDGKTDTADLALFCSRWLVEGPLMKEDINRDNCVDLADFTRLADQWRGGN